MPLCRDCGQVEYACLCHEGDEFKHRAPDDNLEPNFDPYRDGWVNCPKCHGSGEVEDANGVPAPCLDCDDGWVPG